MKRAYVEAETEIVLFEAGDVITESPIETDDNELGGLR